MGRNNILVMIPTYNESENVKKLYKEILEMGIAADILFIDDNSTDGTGAILDGLARGHHEIKVMHRPGKMGIGSAHLDGIRWAYEHGYINLITMDADFTHSPGDIPKFVENLRDSDVFVGSRYMNKASLSEWNLGRKALTNLGHLFTRLFLRMPYDATGAFRLYRLDRIPKEAFELVGSSGYSFFFESLHILHLNRFKIKEIPIILPARTYGHSKMNWQEPFLGLKKLIKIFFNTLFNRRQYLLQGTTKN